MGKIVKPSYEEFVKMKETKNIDWKGYIERLSERSEPISTEEVIAEMKKMGYIVTDERCKMRMNRYTRNGLLVKRIDQFGTRWYLHKVQFDELNKVK